MSMYTTYSGGQLLQQSILFFIIIICHMDIFNFDFVNKFYQLSVVWRR